jgi:hypothetical protein
MGFCHSVRLELEREEVAGPLRLGERADQAARRRIGAVERLEAVRVHPVALEDVPHLGEEVRLVRLRDPDVPLEALGLGRVREVGGADVRGGVLGFTVEEPSLCVQAGGGVVVRDPHLGAEPVEELDRLHLRRAHVRGGEDPERTAERVVPLDERPEPIEARELDERAEEVDPVRARELAREVGEDALVVRVRDEPRGEERAFRRGRSRTRDAEDPRCDPAEDPLPEHRLPGTEVPLGREPLEHRTGEGHLLAGVGARADRHPGRVADQRDELFVDVEVLADVREVDGVRRLEVREPGLERLGDELVVDAGREGGVGAAPDGHGGSVYSRRWRRSGAPRVRSARADDAEERTLGAFANSSMKAEAYCSSVCCCVFRLEHPPATLRPADRVAEPVRGKLPGADSGGNRPDADGCAHLEGESFGATVPP